MSGCIYVCTSVHAQSDVCSANKQEPIPNVHTHTHARTQIHTVMKDGVAWSTDDSQRLREQSTRSFPHLLVEQRAQQRGVYAVLHVYLWIIIRYVLSLHVCCYWVGVVIACLLLLGVCHYWVCVIIEWARSTLQPKHPTTTAKTAIKAAAAAAATITAPAPAAHHLYAML